MIRYYLLVWALILSGASTQAVGQDFSVGRIPVINPQPDLNGVDVASGQFSVELPFSFNAPGAGNLNSKAVFNGRMLTNTLNVYLEDQTLTRPDIGDPSSRQIRIHMGGIDRLFVCNGIGVCTQIAKIDGSMLTRTAEKAYSFRDRDGTQVSFFPMLGQDIWPQPCTDVETGCNAAGYFGYSWASQIKFANGETLTYSNFPTTDGSNYVNTVTSNLGYTYEAVNPCGSSCSIGTSNPGLYWLMHRGAPLSATYRLKKSSLLISSFGINRNIIPVNTLPRAGTIASQDNVTVSDHTGRSSSITLQAKWYGACGSVLATDGTGIGDWGMGSNSAQVDGTNFVPMRIVSPAGRETNISYLNFLQFRQGFNVVPVTSVTRGTATWSYNYTINNWISNDVSLTATDPSGRQRSSRAVGYEIPWETQWGNSYWCNVHTTGSDVVQAKDGLNNTTNFSYQWQGTVGSATMPEANGYSYQYDARGNLTQITAAAKPGSGLANLTVYQASYDASCVNPVKCNKPNWTKDAKGGQTDYVYDAVHGGTLSITLPADSNGIRPQRRFTYESVSTSAGPLYRILQTSECLTSGSCTGTADELKTSLTYWGLTFLKATETLEQGSGGTALTTSYAYDDAGRPIQKTLPLDGSTWYFYDAVGRQVGVIGTDPDGGGPLPHIAQRTTYNADDQVTKVEEGTATNSTVGALAAMTVTKTIDSVYDSTGLKTQDLVSAAGVIVALTQYSYDAADRLECTAQRMNPTAYGSLPASACTLGTEGGFGPDRITRNLYDAAGQLASIQKAYATALQEDYATYTYSPNGKRASLTDARGYTASMTYDGHDRQARWYFPSTTTTGVASTTDYEEYSYDANGNRTSLRKRDGFTITYQYDALNRSTVKIVPESGWAGLQPVHTRDIYYGYDLRGLQTYARFDSASGEGLTFTYDGFGRPVSSSLTMDGVTRNLQYVHDKNGNRVELTQPNIATTTYAYDGLDRLATIYQDPWVTSVLEYSYNNRGLRTSQTGRFGQTTTFGYDPTGRLNALSYDLAGTASDVAFGYGYTPASQMAQQGRDNDAYAWNAHYNVDRSYSTNGLNQYTAAGGALFAYDANGNLGGDGTRRYIYDMENRLVWVGLTDWTHVAALRYDPLGRLYEVVGTGTTTRFLHDGDELVAEYDGAGTMLRRYIHGKNVDDPVVWYEGTGATAPRWLHTDHQGSVIAVTDATGAAIGINSYDEYGIPKPGNLGRFQYTGQAWLPELGMYYYKARIYSPTLGRFLQTDPIGYDDQVNLYAYVWNDPINKIDPTGMDSGSTAYNGAVSLTQARAADDSPERAATERKALEVAGEVLMAVPALRGAGTIYRAWRFERRLEQARNGKLKGWDEQPNRKGQGSRFQDPDDRGNRVRIDKGKPDHPLPSQRRDHVVEQRGGKTVDGDGRSIDAPKPSKTPEAHVPLKDWLRKD